MQFFQPMLTFLVVLVALFSSSISLSCHTCQTPNDFCSLKGGGELKDCDVKDVACRTTMNPSTGTVYRSCIDGGGVSICMSTVDPWKCHMCEYSGCNTEDKLP